jgi:hypothetical protein
LADSKHFWNVTVLADGTLECRWVQAGRVVDGRLVTQSGLETRDRQRRLADHEPTQQDGARG